MHESFYDGITSRIVTARGDLFNTEIVVRRRYESIHELRRIVASEFKWDSFDEDESREQSSCLTRSLACDSEEAIGILLESQDRSRPGSRPWRVHGSRYRISVEVVEAGFRLSEFKAKPFQPHSADLTGITRHDDPLDEVVHLVPGVM